MASKSGNLMLMKNIGMKKRLKSGNLMLMKNIRMKKRLNEMTGGSIRHHKVN